MDPPNPTPIAESRGVQLAVQLDRFRVAAAGELAVAVEARRDQQAAWADLVERGWPIQEAATVDMVQLGMEWLRVWREMLALPVRIRWPRDILRRRSIRRRLAALEAELRPVLPTELWLVVDPLNDVGRATLSHVLQGLLVWAEADSRVGLAKKQKELLATRVAVLTHRALTLGIAPPAAPLDLDGWRSVANAARALAGNATERLELPPQESLASTTS
jgi:hypothetical protein